MQPATTFAERIREARTTSGYTLERLAKRVGCSRALLSKVERGNCADLGANLLIRIADVTERNVRWLATGQGSRLYVGQLPDDLSEAVQHINALKPEQRRIVTELIRSVLNQYAEPSRSNPFPNAKRHY